LGAEISAGFEEGAFTIQNWKVKKKIGTISENRNYFGTAIPKSLHLYIAIK